ncbi:hypothetical protein AAZX31_06G277200 [Glycine max]|uniref:Cell wall protein n=1 Tax=Glycine max TaxID=3847 RepID=I1KF47_SOYBN|nr:putative cell wall protein [Glycine max]KAG5020933.1 hypothetical protein JHK87_016788 [Glycine soja]KAG5047486.1 hypothetical protein JHK86_016892 [Glycine max]KAH1128164.1 hypothetical protein GYH30_016632 [Glycine max]KAH1248007.1 putative cell wall protein [Glycine max]KRH56015.1 hypothetical protein GLYMA_06G296300v4 [Glycine max]|eukprot:XP_003527446.1 putative cell wall protein [Glycine max]
MAFKVSFFLALVLVSNILLLDTTAAGRSIGENSNSEEKKEPEFLFKHEGGVYIPGIGPVGFPHKFHLTPQNPLPGGNGNGGAGTATGSGSPPGSSYVPGGDDTFVPNPGYEVPIPGSGGSVPAPAAP